MSNIEEKLKYLSDTKEAIKTSIKSKGVNISESDSFRSYANKINSIKTEGPIKIVNGLKLGFSTLNEMVNIDTSELNDWQDLFANNYWLLKCPNIDFHNGQRFIYTFDHCKRMTEIVNPLNLPRAYNCEGMFKHCEAITELNIIAPYNGSVRNMFENCFSLYKISIDFTTVSDASRFIIGCSNLTNITINKLGNNSSLTNVDFSPAVSWGDDTLHAGSYKSLTDTIMDTVDRTGKSTCNLKFSTYTLSKITGKLAAKLSQTNYTFGQ